MYSTCSPSTAAEVALGLKRIGFEIASQVIWDNGLFALSRGWFHWRHEPCWVVRKPGIPHLFHGERDQSTVWRAPSPKMIMGGSEEEATALEKLREAERGLRIARAWLHPPLEPGGPTRCPVAS